MRRNSLHILRIGMARTWLALLTEVCFFFGRTTCIPAETSRCAQIADTSSASCSATCFDSPTLPSAEVGKAESQRGHTDTHYVATYA